MRLPQVWRWAAIVAVLLQGIFALMPKLGPIAAPRLSATRPAAAAEFNLLKAINPWVAPR